MTPSPRFPVTISFDVHWGEMDAFGHVNNARYLTWFESCRTAYFLRIGLRVDKPSNLGPIVANIQCDYLAPVVYPARLAVGTRVSHIGNTSFTMEYEVWKEDAPEAPVARGSSVMVMFDYQVQAKVRVPDDLRANIAALESPVSHT